MKLATLAAALLLVACGSTSAAPPNGLSGGLHVFAAASLTESFNALAAAFHAQDPGVAVLLSYAGSPTLVTQIEQGAPADVFASADIANMDRLKGDGLTSGAPQVFAHNVLEIVVAPGNPKGVTGLRDLARPGLIYISAGPTVPAGKYAAQALQKAGVTATPKSLETDVKAVVGKVELGEADAGIVYATDVKAAGGKVTGVPIPESENVVASYPVAVVKGSKNATAAQAFVSYVTSAAGQATLESFGFEHE